MQNRTKASKTKKYIAAGAGVCLLLLFCLMSPLPGMDTQGMRILGSVLCAIAFWAGGVFPDWVTAAGLAILWIVLGKVPYAQAMAGYTSGSVWLVIWACCMAEAVERTGLFARISWGIIRLFRPDFKGIALSLFAVGLLFAPLIPSATAKAVLGAALAESLSDAMGYDPHSDGRCGLFVASFVGFSVSEFASDAYYEDAAFFFGDQVLTFFWCFVWIHLTQFLGMYKENVLCQDGLYHGVLLTHIKFSPNHGVIDRFYNLLQILNVALLGKDDTFPVPLVNIDGVDVVQFFVCAYGIHVGIDAIAGFYALGGKRQPFPFSQRVYDLSFFVLKVFNGEGYCPLNAVKVIVDAHTLEYKQWSGCSVQP